ncbi:MAG TPA: hypothetical protein VFE24_13275 [Pirellulales bacterium]|jgi:hypothetical protein|nr:hypothetical protein [Pirellulales bacterium]
MSANNFGFTHFARRLLAVAALIAAFVFGSLANERAASASTIRIDFTNLNLLYDGTNLYDFTNPNTTRSGSTADASSLASMNFFLDGNLVGTQSVPDIFADVFFKNVLNIPTTPIPVTVTSGGNGNAFGIDLLSTAGTELALNLGSVNVTYASPAPGINITFDSGSASSLFSQNLPFGLVADPSQPIVFSFSSTSLSNVTSLAGFLTGFSSSGTGTITMTALPEPGSYALALGGLLALAVIATRKAKARPAIV